MQTWLCMYRKEKFHIKNYGYRKLGFEEEIKFLLIKNLASSLKLVPVNNSHIKVYWNKRGLNTSMLVALPASKEL